jgi:hypothetical protein
MYRVACDGITLLENSGCSKFLQLCRHKLRRIYAEYDRDLKKIEKEIADMPAAVTRKIDVRGSA